MADVQKITPSLWFDTNAEEAMNYYTSVFENSRIVHIMHYPEEVFDSVQPGMAGKVINGEFELAGQRFICLDGGPLFKFNEAISMLVTCRDQAEVDYFWEKLSHNPENEQCGWCKDQFGLSWQIIPERMGELLGDPDPDRAHRAMRAMLSMKKIVIADLENAAAGAS